MKKVIILICVALHFSVIIYSNIISQEQTLTYFLKHKKEAGKAHKLLQQCPALLTAFDTYGYYTGAETGYGFYAPNVSNQVIFMFTVKDKNNNIISTDQIPFHSQEAYMRSIAISSQFLQQFEQEDSTEAKYMNAMAKSMALWTIDTHPGAHSVSADLLLYNVASNFDIIKRNEKANYIKLKHYEYSL
jgi:hypothetical protein